MNIIEAVKQMFLSIYSISPILFAGFITILIMTILLLVNAIKSFVRWISKK